jgi:hypothetical protein
MVEAVTTEAGRPFPGVVDFAVGSAMVSPVEVAALSMVVANGALAVVDAASVAADMPTVAAVGASVVATVPSVVVDVASAVAVAASVVVDVPLAEADTVVAAMVVAAMVVGAGRFPQPTCNSRGRRHLLSAAAF